MSGARPDTWMPFYVGDYLRDTGHLSPAEHGAYLLLILHYWTSGKPLEDDDNKLRRIARMTAREWDVSRETLAAFFTIAEGIWKHKRIDSELGRAERRSIATSKAGSKGAAKRWQTHSKGITNASQGHWQNDAQSQSQSQSPDGEKNISIEARATVSQMPMAWEPDAAIQQFAALKCINPAELAEQAELFRDHYLANGHTAADWSARFRLWLNRRHQFYRRAKPNGKPHNEAIRQALDEFNVWCDRGNEARDSTYRERGHDGLPKPA